MKLASFNVENLFARAKVLNLPTWAQGEPRLAAYERFNRIAQNVAYSEADKASMIEDLLTLQVVVRSPRSGLIVFPPDRDSPWATLRENRGEFVIERTATGIEIVATGRKDWTGWLDLVVEPVDEIATRMTSRVISELAPDVLAVIEAENRPALVEFNEVMLDRMFPHVMLVDGNDRRGIDVGLLTGSAYPIRNVASHVDDRDVTNPDPAKRNRALFSRDAPVYRIDLGPTNEPLFVIVNHLKSQSWTDGNPTPLRRRQAQRLADVYRGVRMAGAQLVAVVGDFNRGPDAVSQPAESLESLYQPGLGLVDAFSLPTFDAGPKLGTWQSCSLRNRLDYIFVSPELAPRVTAGGVFRQGLWGAPTTKRPPPWPIFDEITESKHAASDHGAIWVDLDLT